MDQSVQMKLKFRCPPEYEGLIPQPVPAVQGLPDWYKTMPQKSFSPIPLIQLMMLGLMVAATIKTKSKPGKELITSPAREMTVPADPPK